MALVPFTALAELPLLPATLTCCCFSSSCSTSPFPKTTLVLVHLYQPSLAPKDLVYIQNIQHSLLNITLCRCVHFHRINSVSVTVVACVLYTMQIKNMCLMVTAKHKNWTLQQLLLGPFRDPPGWISPSKPALGATLLQDSWPTHMLAHAH